VARPAIQQVSGLDPETARRLSTVQAVLAVAAILAVGAGIFYFTAEGKGRRS
jgi:hypothetical protein